MVTFKLLFLAVACICVNALPEVPPKITIFSDEKLEGGPFEEKHVITPTGGTARNTLSPSDYRLPTTTRPIHYNVLWEIDVDQQTFNGVVQIELAATQAGINEIVIHADDLDIGTVSLQQGATVIQQQYELQKETQFMRINLTTGTLNFSATNPVIYNLTISFNSTLRDDMYGIYKSWFKNNPASDEVSWMAATQFAITAARYAFPCYDEPSFKATFDVTIRRPIRFRSWFCTLLNTTRNSSNPAFQEDVYHRTPVMSTYILALVVAEYDALELVYNGTLRYDVIARPAAIAQGQGEYAYRVGQLLLANMSAYTGIDFYSQHPYLKMTQAAIPDFSFSAMENWGLLAYREAFLMYDEENTSYLYKQFIAYILSHEIAHMWFGNWVTTAWWDAVWLNEGFARYYEYFLTHTVEEHMGMDIRFINEQVHTSLLTDSADNPHPLTNPNVGSPASIMAMFSLLSYNKGAVIIRMTEHLLGSDVHQQALRNYLINRALDVALPMHLFQELQDAAVAAGSIAQYGPDFSVIDYYKTWTEQGGHPVLNVQVNHQTGQMMITQRRFNINTGYSSINTNWIIPITFATASNPDFENTKPSHILRKAVTVIDRGSTGDQWVVFNKQQTGYYRVNYDDYTWNLIVIALRGPNRTLIHEYSRAQIVNDVFQFARSGLMTYTRAFNILSFLENETEYTPWVAAITGFSWLRSRFAGTSHITGLNSLIVRWATRAMNELTYYPIPNEPFMRAYLRWQLADVMCELNVPACREAANAQFSLLRNNGTEVPVNSRNWVYCNALRDGTTQDFDFLFERFRTSNVYNEKLQILLILGCTPHAQSINRFLDAIVTDNFLIRRHDYSTSINSAVSGNEDNTQIVFEYIKANLVNVTQAFGSAATPLSFVSSRLRTIAEVQEFQAWATQNSATLGADLQAVYNNAESTRQGIMWATQVAADLNNYFDTGDDIITASTAPPLVVTSPSTVSQPDLSEPVTPSIPDSAVTSLVSLTILVIALIANFVL